MHNPAKNKATYSQRIKEKARELGFFKCGIAKARRLTEMEEPLKRCLRNGYHGDMHYMQNHFEKRLDPRKLVPGAKSVISVLLNYYPSQTQPWDTLQISKYAYGKDYHFVMKEKLHTLLAYINEEIKEINGRAFVDSAPVLDRKWAQESGLGWIGKNTNLITREHGSYFFIGELIIDLELEYDTPMQYNYCGNCTKCIDKCPANAIVKPYTIDSNKCISYLTIEYRGELSEKNKTGITNQIFGCDVCQDVCPWNKKAITHDVQEFDPHPDLLKMNDSDWKDMTKGTFNTLFKKSAVKRTKYHGLKRNIDYIFAHNINMKHK